MAALALFGLHIGLLVAPQKMVVYSGVTTNVRIAKCDELIAMPSGEIWTVKKYAHVFFGGSACDKE